MSQLPSFHNILHHSKITAENEFFIQYTNQELPNYYDANFLLLKYAPTLPEFQLIEKLHKDYQESIHQDHMKIKWPENTGLYMDILDYLTFEQYEIGKQELMYAQPKDLTLGEMNEEIQMDPVTKSNLDLFLKLNKKEDGNLGSGFAELKEKVYHHQFSYPNVTFYLASIEDTPVGSFISNQSVEYMEIDNVLTDREFRNQRVATTMFHFIRAKAIAQRKSILLVADAEDTPREMYLKMGFQVISSQIMAEKTVL